MDVAGVYRVVRHKDHAVPESLPRPLLGAEHPLDIRVWPKVQVRIQGMPALPEEPLLLVSASRRFGGAVQRVRFKRRVRMALLELLRQQPFPAVHPLVLFVRPGRGAPRGGDLPYADILRTLRQALARI